MIECNFVPCNFSSTLTVEHPTRLLWLCKEDLLGECTLVHSSDTVTSWTVTCENSTFFNVNTHATRKNLWLLLQQRLRTFFHFKIHLHAQIFGELKKTFTYPERWVIRRNIAVSEPEWVSKSEISQPCADGIGERFSQSTSPHNSSKYACVLIKAETNGGLYPL